jgi:hypothetical protein
MVEILEMQIRSSQKRCSVHPSMPQNVHSFVVKGIRTLAGHGLNGRSPGTSHNALGCLANAMLLKAPTRQMFVDLRLEDEICAKLKSTDLDDEFLVSRVLFFTTYETSIDLPALMQQNHLAEILTNTLARHADREDARSANTPISPKEQLALAETLKLLYNVTHFCPERSAAFTPTIPYLVRLLCSLGSSPQKPLDPPVGQLVHAFINLDLGSKEGRAALYPDNSSTALAARLVQLLEATANAYTDEEAEDVVTPLIAVLNSVYQVAPDASQHLIQSKLLPADEDRQQVLGRSKSLSSWLLRSSTNPSAPALRKALASLLFDLSNRDAAKLVEKIGLGYASGILFQSNLPIPSDAAARSGGDAFAPVVNPITGQFVEREAVPDLPPMSDEEKEREAERLFVLFERSADPIWFNCTYADNETRLKRTGIIDVQNPVELAARQGRIEELDDSAEELD